MIVAYAYLLILSTWLFYLAIMHLAKYKDDLYPVAKFHAYILLGIGAVLDVLLNVLVGSIVFLQIPHYRRLFLTARLSHILENESGWRVPIARWICVHLLDQFDPDGRHCG